MATLTGNTIASTYTGLLSVSGAVGADTVEAVTDGAGTSTSLSLSQQRATITLGSGAADDFIVDGTTLVVEGDNNRVGIGTASPDAQVHVQGPTTAGQSGTIRLEGGNSTADGGGSVDFYNNSVHQAGIYGARVDANTGKLYFRTTTSSSIATVLTLQSGNATLAGDLIMADGKGIDFSAKTPDESGAGSMSNEILDDYEEGTWDVSLTSDGGTAPTISSGENRMTYTKIGRVVFISGQAGTCNCTGSTGALQLAGLPFDTISDQTDRAERINLIANTNNDTYSHLLLASTVGAGGSTLNISGKKPDGTMDSSVAGTMDGEGNFDLNIVGYYVTD